MKNRVLSQPVIKKSQSKFGRLIVVTGARQTGKTTLLKKMFNDYTYITLDDPTVRPHYTAMSATSWKEQFPQAILDEIQKIPSLFESIKATYDSYEETRYILSGSSQILLLKNIRESLAGRVSLFELYPLTLPEQLTKSWEEEVQPSRLVQWLKSESYEKSLLDGIPPTNEVFIKTEKSFNDYLQFGAMPAISDTMLSKDDRKDWLKNYIRTYLERDIRYIAQIQDFNAFINAQIITAGISGQLINYNNLAKLANISPQTAKKYVSYLSLSYQVILLKPWLRNLHRRLSKSPKLHFMDPGIQRSIINRYGTPTGHEYESAVIAEIIKQIKSYRMDIQYYHLRTSDGREIDLLLETGEGYIPIEIKMTNTISKTDCRHLRKLDEILDKPIICSLILSNDNRVQRLEDNIIALPAAWLLGPSNITPA